MLGGGLVLRRSFWASWSSLSSLVVSSSFLWNTSASGEDQAHAETRCCCIKSSECVRAQRLWGLLVSPPT